MPRKSERAIVYSKTNVGGYFFDAIISASHNTSLNITNFPVETGASVSDHSYLNPATLKLSIMMSDVVTDTSSNSFSGSDRSVQAYNVLLEAQKNRKPVKVYTSLKAYDNMLIKDIDAQQDEDTYEALKVDVTLREVLIAKVGTVKISLDAQATQQTKMGDISAQNLTEEEKSAYRSILFNIVSGSR